MSKHSRKLESLDSSASDSSSCASSSDKSSSSHSDKSSCSSSSSDKSSRSDKSSSCDKSSSSSSSDKSSSSSSSDKSSSSSSSDKSSSSSSSDKSSRCDGRTGKYTLFYDNFQCGFRPETYGSPYVYFTAGEALPLANDAAGGVTSQCGDLIVRSTPFTFTNPTSLDHVKYLVSIRDAFNAPRSGAELVYEVVAAAQQTGLGGLPGILAAPAGSLSGVSNVNTDCRLACAAFNLVDLETNLVFDFLLTNEDIYAVYERLPFLRTEWGGPGPNYDGFTHVIPVGKRNVIDPLNDFTKLALAYNYHENYVRWIINDQEVYRINRIGLPLERKYRVTEYTAVGQLPASAQLIRPKQFQPGFGNFSLMDFYNPQNPGQVNNAGLVDLTLFGLLPQVNPLVTNLDGTTIAANFLSGYPVAGANGTNFGQGNILRLKYLSVYLQAAVEEHREFADLYACKDCVEIPRCTLNRIQGVNSHSDVSLIHCKGSIKDCDCCKERQDPCNTPLDQVDICCPDRRDRKHKCKCYEAQTRKRLCPGTAAAQANLAQTIQQASQP